MATLSDGFKDIFLAGIGAMAITGEKPRIWLISSSPKASSPWIRASRSTPN